MDNSNSDMYSWMKDLFPICRSITGDGVRETLNYFKKVLPDLKIHEVPSGTKAFDWEVPNEWNIKDAFVKDEFGNKVIDFNESNLHVVGYSEPVDKWLVFSELEPHLYSLENQPNAIPYITSYYKQHWGFCLTHDQRMELAKEPQKKYHVKIDSTLKPGHLTYGQLIIPGETKDEILLSSYVCHPSMANNELSGPCVLAKLAEWIHELPSRRHTYRILFLVETIGSIVYLSRHFEMMKENTVAGFVLTCVGDELEYNYIPSKYGNSLADKATIHVLNNFTDGFVTRSFLDRGSDERQYCSPGIDLPVCSVTRSKYGDYPEYHTSLDDLSFVTPRGLEQSYALYKKIITVLENNYKYKTNVLCEPQLGKRGLYPNLSTKNINQELKVRMNFIAYADGTLDLLEIAEKIDSDVLTLVEHAKVLDKEGLLYKV